MSQYKVLILSALRRGWPLIAVAVALLLWSTSRAQPVESAPDGSPAQIAEESGATMHPAGLPRAAASEWHSSRVTPESSARMRRPARLTTRARIRHGAAMAAVLREPTRHVPGTRRVWSVHAAKPTDPDSH